MNYMSIGVNRWIGRYLRPGAVKANSGKCNSGMYIDIPRK